MQAAIYRRISTDDQSDFSLEAQERACRAECERRGWQVYRVYTDDGISGKTAQRPALRALLTDVQAGRIKAVVVHKTNRLMRNLQKLLETVGVIRDAGAAFVSVTENLDFSSPLGWAMFQVQGVFAELYVNDLATETRKGLLEKARQGHWVGGICPYGYRRVDKDTIVPGDDADLVRALFDLYATGTYSYARLADVMNTRSERHFRTEGVRDILSNRAYRGEVSCGGEHFPGNHEALVTVDLWDRCASLRAARATKQHDGQHPKPRSNPRGVLLDVGCCAACGQKLWQRICGNATSRNGYYMCAGNSRRTCSVRMSNIDPTDRATLDLIRGFSLAAEWQAEVLQHVQAALQPSAPLPPVDHAAIAAKLDRLSVAWVNGNVSDAVYAQQTTALKAQLVAPSPSASVSIDLVAAQAALESVGTLIDHATLQERRELVNMVLARVWVAAGGIIHAVHPLGLYGMLWRETRRLFSLERETGLEPATFCLGNRCATIAPFPHRASIRILE